jgi:hypothetical protein
MALNETLTWKEVGAIVTDSKTGAQVRDAFKNQHAEKVLLGKGTTLYKFNDYQTPVAGDETAALQANPLSAQAARYFTMTLSPWWSPYHPFRHDAGWEERKKLARHFGISIRELGRLTSAVREDWNSLQYLLVITLKTPAYAWFGGFAAMPRHIQGSKLIDTAPAGMADFMPEGRGATRKLPGGATQFYIPNLRPANVLEWRAESLLGL